MLLCSGHTTHIHALSFILLWACLEADKHVKRNSHIIRTAARPGGMRDRRLRGCVCVYSACVCNVKVKEAKRTQVVVNFNEEDWNTDRSLWTDSAAGRTGPGEAT